jgi:hypothetical protein
VFAQICVFEIKELHFLHQLHNFVIFPKLYARWYHVVLEQDIMLGQVAGYRRQGKPRMCWLHSFKEATGLQLEVLKETVQDRKKLRMLVGEKTLNREHTNVK